MTQSVMNGDSTRIHPTAVVDPKAQIDVGVDIGPYAVVGPEVSIGSGTRIGPHVVLDGRVSIGQRNRIFPGASIGAEPQDLKYNGAPTEVVIGDDNAIRECVTINRATHEGEQTRIGNGNLLMAYSHLGHNCDLGNRIVIANGVAVAGHVVIGDRAVIGGCRASRKQASPPGAARWRTPGPWPWAIGLSSPLGLSQASLQLVWVWPASKPANS